jgi:hypothetical protein
LTWLWQIMAFINSGSLQKNCTHFQKAHANAAYAPVLTIPDQTNKRPAIYWICWPNS